MKRRPDPVENSLSFRIAVCVALMLAGVAVLQQGVGGPLLWVVVLVGYPVAFVIAYITRDDRPPLMRAIVTGVAFLILMMFVASFADRTAGGFAALQIPLAEVFLWLLLLHAVDSPGRRGLFIALLSSVVIMAVASVLSISMGIAPYLLLWSVAAITALVLGQRAELATLPSLAPKRPRPRRTIVSVSIAVVVSVLVVVLLGAAMFMVAPVAGTDRALTFPAELPHVSSVPVLGGLANPSLGSDDPARDSQPGESNESRKSFGYFGFSNQLDTAIRGRPDNTLVIRVRASAPDYWRAQTFDTWDGRVWRASRARPIVLRGSQPIRIPAAPDDGPEVSTVGDDKLVQTYYIEQQGPNAIFAANQPRQLYFTDRIAFQLPDGSLRAGVQLDKGSVYTVVSHRRLVTVEAMQAIDPRTVPEAVLVHYMGDPVTTPRVRALARSITANAPTWYDKVQALEAWMGAHTKYTLDIPPLPRGKDAVDQFLFVDKQGFCEQIGTSLVVMLRSLGIPARLAVGYATGERNPFTGLYEVRAKDAHAWAEVYFPGVGWQGFDPTAHVPLAGESAIDAAGQGTFAYLNNRISIPDWAPIALLVLAAAVGGAFLGRLIVLRRRRRRARVAPSWAGARLVQLEALGARRGRARAPGETTPEYAAALSGLDPGAAATLHRIARILDAAMFSERPPGADARAIVDESITELAARWQGARERNERVLVST